MRELKKLAYFLLMGIPAFLIAIWLNYVFVFQFKWEKSLAYALVLLIQVLINFFMCRCFVFRKRKDRHLFVQLGQFACGIVLFRVADWVAYLFLVQVIGVYFLAAQVVNVLVFVLLKFRFSKHVLESPLNI